MNKLILAVCGLVLVVSLANLYLHLETGAKLKKLEPLSHEVEKLKPLLEKASKPPELPPLPVPPKREVPEKTGETEGKPRPKLPLPPLPKKD